MGFYAARLIVKYISLIVVVLFIAFTFWFSKKTEELTLDQMNKMNSLIVEYMTQAVKNNNPNAEDIEFSKIYTEVVESGKKMKAHFKFSYMEPNGEGGLEKVYRSGTFLVTSEDGQKWKAQIESAGDVKVEFMQPFEITDGVPSKPAPVKDESQQESSEDVEVEEEVSVEESDS